MKVEKISIEQMLKILIGFQKKGVKEVDLIGEVDNQNGDRVWFYPVITTCDTTTVVPTLEIQKGKRGWEEIHNLEQYG